MTGVLIEMDRTGRVTNVFIIGGSEAEAEVAQRALARITKPGAWAWLRRLLRFRPLPGRYLTAGDRTPGAPRLSP